MNRDRKLELALKHELRAAGTPDRDACVDAETLGAWADGGLDAVQLAAVELHVSTCGRCQAILGATARSAPLPPVAEANAGFSVWKWWLAPIAAGAAAVTLWMVVPQETTPAPAPPAQVSEIQKDAPAEANERQAAAQPAPPAAPPADNKLADAPLNRSNTPPSGFEDRPGRRDELLERKPENRIADQAAIGAVAAPPATARPVESPGLADAREAARQKATGTSAMLEIVSPDSRRRWRVNGASIERSEDSGATWIGVHQVTGETITGGTAPAGTICWLIGANGVVLVTADGATFARVPIPERVALTAITATDARSAAVTAADGRRFTTDDAGRSWRRN